MSPVPSMKTGFSPLVEPDAGPDKDFLRAVVALMHVLCEEAVGSAARFSACCGRRIITGQDTLLALKYESHKFWHKPIDQRFLEHLEEEKTHTYDTDEESDEDEGEESGEEQEEEKYHTLAKVEHDRPFYEEVMQIQRDWDAWNPEDPVKRLLKNAIESTAARYADASEDV